MTWKNRIAALGIVCSLAILVSLGTWQLLRLQQKNALIAQAESRLHSASIPLTECARLDIDQLNYSNVTLRGTWLPQHEVYLYTSTVNDKNGDTEVGWSVLTPLRQSENCTLIVNRGFIRQEDKDQFTARALAAPEEEVKIQGVLRKGETPNPFTPAPDIAKKLVYTNTPAVIAKAENLDHVRDIVIVQQTPPGAYPAQLPTTVDYPNRHLGYALTWYGLAIALLCMSLLKHVRPRKAL